MREETSTIGFIHGPIFYVNSEKTPSIAKVWLETALNDRIWRTKVLRWFFTNYKKFRDQLHPYT